MHVTMFGLGYVGLPLAKLLIKKGAKVTGIDPSPDAQNGAKDEGVDISKDVRKSVKMADVIIVCVPTPVDENNKPDLSAVKAVAVSIAEGLRNDQLICLESTISPGVSENIVLPILQRTGLKPGTDFFMVHCPERVDPGNKNWDVHNIPRVIGGISNESLKRGVDFYTKYLDAKLHTVSSIRTAEATKIFENSFRDINIAFVNEMAKSFDHFNIDVTEVITAASSKPFGFLAHYPGCGVGGHCIPVDPYYLIESAKEKGFFHRFLTMAREVNNGMPQYAVEKLIDKLTELGLYGQDLRICVLGMSYKKDVADLRESPAFRIRALLEEKGFTTETYDPYVPSLSTISSLKDACQCDCLFIATDHSEFKELENVKDCKVKLIFDGRNMLDKKIIGAKGIHYFGIGRN